MTSNREELTLWIAFTCAAGALIAVILFTVFGLLVLLALSIMAIVYGGVPGIIIGVIGIVVEVLFLNHYLRNFIP